MLITFNDSDFIPEKVGRKSYNLGVLKKQGYPTLEGISLVPPITEIDLEQAWNYFHGEKILAVRSSMINEDGNQVSMAGKFETVLGIKTFDAFKKAVQRVLQSNDHSIHSSVLVQKMFDSHISGVLFTNTAENKGDMFIESTYGIGELMVSGKILPDQYIVNRETFNTIETISHKKMYGIFLETEKLEIGDIAPFCFGKTRKLAGMGNAKFLGSIAYFDRKRSSLNQVHLKKLVELGTNLEALFGCPQDIEWAICNDEVKILQSRPITKALSISIHQKNYNDDGYLSGSTASDGEVKGIVRTSFIKGEIITEPYIYVGMELKPELLYQLDKVKGIVTEYGGLLCHAAIVARELNIPCLVGVDDVTSKIQQGDEIYLNATKGYIEIQKT